MRAPMRIGEFEFHPDAGELCRGDVTCRLQPQTVALLVQLVEHAGEVLSREDLRQSLWQGNTYGEFDDGLNHAVARLREAFGDAARSPHYIETIPRRGYRLIAPVARMSPPEVPPVDLPCPADAPRSYPRMLGLAAGGFAVLASVAWLLTSAGADTPTGGRPDAEAYEEYLKGNIQVERYGDVRAVERALQHYRAAVARDERFGAAQAGVAIAYMQKMMYESDPVTYLRDASEAAHRAVALDPGLADGHLAVGRLESFYNWNWRAADQAFARGCSSTPPTRSRATTTPPTSPRSAGTRKPSRLPGPRSLWLPTLCRRTRCSRRPTSPPARPPTRSTSVAAPCPSIRASR